jgi:hypothetical protein
MFGVAVGIGNGIQFNNNNNNNNNNPWGRDSFIQSVPPLGMVMVFILIIFQDVASVTQSIYMVQIKMADGRTTSE